MPISRSQMERQLRMGGGIMQVAPRQEYFLGGIGKAIKGAVKGVAKGIKGLIKSPIGKAALIGGGLFGVPGTQFGGLLGKGSLANIIGQKAMTQAPFAKGTGIKGFFQNILGGEKTLGTTAKVFAGGTALGAVLEAAGLNTDNPSEMAAATRDIDALKGYLRTGYKELNPKADDNEVESFVEENTREYKAGGGMMRKNFAMGSEEDIPEIEEMAAATKDIGALKGYLRTGYKQLNPKADDNEVEAFVEENTREYKAGGGVMRKNFAIGSEEDIPEIEEMPSEELLDILKSIGADKEQASGIKSIKNKMTSQPDPMDERNTMMENIAMEEFGKPLRLLNEEEIIQIEEMMDEMSKKKSDRKLMAFSGGSKMRDLGLDEDYIREIRIQWLEAGKPMSFSNFLRNDIERQAEMADEAKAQDFSYGGRVGFESGTPKKKKSLDDIPLIKGPHKIKYDEDGNRIKPEMPEGKPYKYNPELIHKRNIMPYLLTKPLKKAMGGRIGYARGTDEIVDQASGIMGLPQRTNKAGVKELDLRETGGFIPPVGVKEKADDIPAMLSNNEFVFTADAVRGMGGGNVNKGAQRLYDQMKFLEKGGKV